MFAAFSKGSGFVAYGAALVYYLVIVSVLTLAQNRIEHVLSRGYR